MGGSGRGYGGLNGNGKKHNKSWTIQKLNKYK